MSCHQSAPRAARRTRSTVLAVVATGAMLVAGVVGCRSLASSSPPSSSLPSSAASSPDTRAGHDRRALGEAAGAVPDGVTVFDDLPAVARLDPDLLEALRRAADGAADDGVEFVVNSGWRSPEYQEELFDEAVTEHGSEEAAARLVATPDTSLHVSGDAVDIGPSGATAWLSEHGAEYGLCRIYSNEPWHYELRPDAVEDGCPPRYADPTHDPRMQ